MPFSTRSATTSTIASTYSVARGRTSGWAMLSRSISSMNTRSKRADNSGSVVPASAARAMMLSSMSVMLDTAHTSHPDQRRYRTRMSKARVERAWPRWGAS